MGNCCQVSQVIEIQENKSVTKRNSIRSSSYILDKYSIQKDFRKKYEYQSLIGSGAFGKVRLYLDRDSKTFKYAIKTIKKKHIQTTQYRKYKTRSEYFAKFRSS